MEYKRYSDSFVIYYRDSATGRIGHLRTATCRQRGAFHSTTMNHYFNVTLVFCLLELLCVWHLWRDEQYLPAYAAYKDHPETMEYIAHWCANNKFLMIVLLAIGNLSKEPLVKACMALSMAMGSMLYFVNMHPLKETLAARDAGPAFDTAHQAIGVMVPLWLFVTYSELRAYQKEKAKAKAE